MLIAAGAGGAQTAERMPVGVSAGLAYLVALAGPAGASGFDPARAAEVLAFVDAPKPPGAVYTSEPMLEASSGYLELDVRRGLSDLLRITFNPVIPWFTSTPSSLRLSDWRRTEKPSPEFPRLWELRELAGPVAIRGVEHVENTPDLSTGGYYRYDLNRFLVLYEAAGGRRAFVSVSRQTGPSEVGRKGFIIGRDEEWNYFYSGEPGLNFPGLGWVKSYMYDSAGVTVYVESAPGAGQVRVANFKWVRAGWAGLNVVETEHILKGLKRFARAFREVVESPRLPPVDVLEEACRRIEGLSEAALRERVDRYRLLLAERAERLAGGARRTLPESFWKEETWSRLGREEMESILVLENLKGALGKSPEAEWRGLLASRR
jgi:hypothetical protein